MQIRERWVCLAIAPKSGFAFVLRCRMEAWEFSCIMKILLPSTALNCLYLMLI